MNIQPPENKKCPSYPSRARLAVVAGVLLAAGSAVWWIAANMRTTPESVWAKQDAINELETKDLALFVRQMEEGAALLAPYAEGGCAVPEPVMQQLQESTAKYAKLRAQLWRVPPFGSERFGLRPSTLGVLPMHRPVVSYMQGLNEMLLMDSRMSAYELLGAYTCAEEPMPREKLQAWSDFLSVQIRNREGRTLYYRLLEEDVRGMEKKMLDEEDALLERYADGSASVPPAVLQELQGMVSKYADDYVRILSQYGWPDERKLAEIRASGRMPKTEADAADGMRTEERKLYDRQIAEHRLALGYHVSDASPMPQAMLVDLQGLVLKHIRERKALRATLAAKTGLPDAASDSVASPHLLPGMHDE